MFCLSVTFCFVCVWLFFCLKVIFCFVLEWWKIRCDSEQGWIISFQLWRFPRPPTLVHFNKILKLISWCETWNILDHIQLHITVTEHIQLYITVTEDIQLYITVTEHIQLYITVTVHLQLYIAITVHISLYITVTEHIQFYFTVTYSVTYTVIYSILLFLFHITGNVLLLVCYYFCFSSWAMRRHEAPSYKAKLFILPSSRVVYFFTMSCGIKSTLSRSQILPWVATGDCLDNGAV